jgi:hypothetical protein
MEGYTNKNIDPSHSEMGNRKRGRELSATTTTKSEETSNTERERRKKMTQMFTHLNTIVPTLRPNVKIIPYFFIFSILNPNI